MDLLAYTLVLYFAYYVLGRTRICRRPREWAQRVLPWWVTYPLGCPLCFGWWMGVILMTGRLLFTGWLVLDWVALFAAPILLLILDEAVRALERVNTPPVIAGATSVSTSAGSSTITARVGAPIGAGEIVMMDGKGWIGPVGTTAPSPDWIRLTNPLPPPWHGPLPEGWTTWYTSGNGEYGRGFACAALRGRKVRTNYFNGREGIIESGFRNGDDCSGSFGELMYRLRWTQGDTHDRYGDVPVKSCIFLDDTPFNPLDHEQTR